MACGKWRILGGIMLLSLMTPSCQFPRLRQNLLARQTNFATGMHVNQPGASPVTGGLEPRPIPIRTAHVPEHLAQMAEQTAHFEDSNRVLATQVYNLQEQLVEKDRLLKESADEIQKATEQIQTTRKELQRSKQELESLRQKLRDSEKESQETMESAIRSMEQFLDRHKGQGKESPPTELPKVP